jgi:hypothetical protein
MSGFQMFTELVFVLFNFSLAVSNKKLLIIFAYIKCAFRRSRCNIPNRNSDEIFLFVNLDYKRLPIVVY